MKETTFIVEAEDGLHARPAGTIAKVASQYESQVDIIAQGKIKNAKSVLSIMSMGLKKADNVTLRVTGSDADLAIDALQKLIENNFHYELSK